VRNRQKENRPLSKARMKIHASMPVEFEGLYCNVKKI
jgi:hypothetical protein